MFLWHLICMSRERRKLRNVFILALFAPIVAWAILGHINDWPRMWVYVVLFGELALVLAIDRIVKSQLHQELRERFRRIIGGMSVEILPNPVTQYDVDRVLEFLASKVSSYTEEQRFIGTKVKASPKDDYHRKTLQLINEWVKNALKNFWRAHWLARVFGFEVKKSWKEYLPTQAA